MIEAKVVKIDEEFMVILSEGKYYRLKCRRLPLPGLRKPHEQGGTEGDGHHAGRVGEREEGVTTDDTDDTEERRMQFGIHPCSSVLFVVHLRGGFG